MLLCEFYFICLHLVSSLDHLSFKHFFFDKLLVAELTAHSVTVTEGPLGLSRVVGFTIGVAVLKARLAHSHAICQSARAALVPIHCHSCFSIERVQANALFHDGFTP